MEQLHERQIQQARTRMRSLLCEAAGREEIIEWIKEVITSTLDHSQDLLRDVGVEQETIRSSVSSQYHWGNRVHSFERKAHGVLDEVGESVRMLGDGEGEAKLLDQIRQAHELVTRVCAMCIELINGEGDLLVEES